MLRYHNSFPVNGTDYYTGYSTYICQVRQQSKKNQWKLLLLSLNTKEYVGVNPKLIVVPITPHDERTHGYIWRIPSFDILRGQVKVRVPVQSMREECDEAPGGGRTYGHLGIRGVGRYTLCP